jgi:hypothetical protein
MGASLAEPFLVMSFGMTPLEVEAVWRVLPKGPITHTHTHTYIYLIVFSFTNYHKCGY